MKKEENRGNKSKIDPAATVTPYYLANALTQYDVEQDGRRPAQLCEEKVELAKNETDLNHK